MNRLTTVLYPSMPSSGSEGSTGTPANAAGRGISPIDTNLPLLPGMSRSIYDDPRSTRFDSPPLVPTPIIARAHSAADALQVKHRPELLFPIVDDQLQSNGRVSGSSTPTPHQVRRPDRTLRTNLMQVGVSQQQGKGKRGQQQQAAGPSGRLSSMAQGPNGRYVVGGGQYLRVHEIANPPDPEMLTSAAATKPLGRQAGGSFAKGPGGVTISEVCNLWKGSWAIGKGVNDVDWGTANFDTKIVTATPSGNFMIFDVNRGKLDREVTGGHPRPMNCISISQSNSMPYLLITGGTEGQARLWDLRETENSGRSKYWKHNAPVTALCFAEDDPRHFIVGTEAGGLFRYDVRYPNKTVGKVWGAHGSKPVLDLKWKSADEPGSGGHGWLASAGGDRTVQIWDMTHRWDKGTVSQPAHILHTAYPIRCVDWRPTAPTELVVVPFEQPLASAVTDVRPGMQPPLIPDDSDSALEVWDVRRHYIAKYSLPSLSGNAVSAIWDDKDSIVACYQNGGLAQIDLQSRVVPKTIPLESVRRQVVAWSPKAELAYAVDRFKMGEIPFDDVTDKYASHWQVGRHKKAVADPAYDPVQAMGVLPLNDGEDAEFIYMAQQYRLEGEAPERLCKWNREVAELCGRTDEARVWDFLKGLIEEFRPATDGLFNEAVFTTSSPNGAAPRVQSPRYPPPDKRPSEDSGVSSEHHGILLCPSDSVEFVEDEEEERRGPARDDRDDSSASDSSDDEPLTPPRAPRRTRFKTFITPHTGEHRSSTGGGSVKRSSLPSRTESSMPLSFTRENSHYGLVPRKKALVIETPMSEDTPTPIADMDYPDPYGIAAALESISAPAQRASASLRAGFSARSTPHSTRPPSPSLLERVAAATARLGSVPGSVVGSARPSVVAETKNRIQPAAITRHTQRSYALAEWDSYRESRCSTLLNWWKAYVDDGEVQVATAVFVIGSPVVDFPQHQAERVVDAYLDLLGRYRLQIQEAYIRRFANVLHAQTVPGQDGVTHILHCSGCGKSTGSLDDDPEKKRFWWCTKCRRGAKICSVCREPVKGLWLGCPRCRHGGHHRCMRLYMLDTTRSAPAPQLRPASPPMVPRRSSTLQAAGNSSSLDSVLTERSRKASKASDLSRGSEPSEGAAVADGAGGGAVVTWNVCPGGCGCQCRTVHPM